MAAAPGVRDVAEAIRTVVDMFIHDHFEFEGVHFEVAEHVETDGTFGLTVDGSVFEVSVKAR